MTTPTLTRLGRRVERTLSPVACRLSPGIRTPRLRAIAWHRAQLLALSELEDDPEAQDAAGAYHLRQLGLLLREEEASGARTPAVHLDRPTARALRDLIVGYGEHVAAGVPLPALPAASHERLGAVLRALDDDEEEEDA